MKNKIINSVPAYVGLAACFINDVLCDNNNPTTTPSSVNRHLTLGGSFGYVPAGMVTIGLCVSMFAYIYKNMHRTHELESLGCIGENDVESNALYDL